MVSCWLWKADIEAERIGDVEMRIGSAGEPIFTGVHALIMNGTLNKVHLYYDYFYKYQINRNLGGLF